MKLLNWKPRRVHCGKIIENESLIAELKRKIEDAVSEKVVEGEKKC